MIPQLTINDKLLDQILSNQLDIAITEFTPVLERKHIYASCLYLKKIIICMYPNHIR